MFEPFGIFLQYNQCVIKNNTDFYTFFKSKSSGVTEKFKAGLTYCTCTDSTNQSFYITDARHIKCDSRL